MSEKQRYKIVNGDGKVLLTTNRKATAKGLIPKLKLNKNEILKIVKIEE